MRGQAPGARARRTHRLVWWIVLVQTVFALGFSLTVPLYRGPDEAAHVDMIRRYRDVPGYPDPSRTVDLAPEVRESQALASEPGRPKPPQRVADAVPRPDRPTFDELRSSPPRSRKYNQMSQHPPAFYASMASASGGLMAWLPDGAWSWDREVYLYRLLGILLLAPLPWFAAQAAGALGASPVTGAIAAAVTMLVPGETVIRAVVNNDSLAVLASSAAVCGALVATERPRTSVIALTSAASAVALLTKSTAAFPAMWALAVLAVVVVRDSARPGIRAKWPSLAVIVGAAGIGGSWLVSNVVRFQDPQPAPAPPAPSRPGFDPSVWDFAGRWIDEVSHTFFGRPAERTGVALTQWQVTSVGLAVAVLAVVGAVWILPRVRRAPTIALSLLVVGEVALMLRANWNHHARTGGFTALQGRYLYAVLVPFAVLVAFGVVRLARVLPWPRATNVALWTVTAVGVALHLFLLWSSLRAGYWDAAGRGIRGQLDALAAWSPLPRVLTASIGLLQLATPLLVLVPLGAAVRRTRNRSEVPG